MSKTIIVTGGAGFIGSALVRHLIANSDHRIVNVDCLTYAGNLDSVAMAAGNPRYVFEQVDIRDSVAVQRVFDTHRPDGVIHLAAESHVDRSIDGPRVFIETNVMGTYTLLEAARRHWMALEGDARAGFRFHHVSTDEVYGSLGETGLFTEETAYQPNSPYSASKAASDHLVRAWHHTYGLPVLTTNCSNNYGPYHFPEKLVPLMILNALEGKPLPVYGSGKQVRDWLYVEDHAEALLLVAERGEPGETYAIGGQNELSNRDVVRAICTLLDGLRPDPAGPHERLITYVADRPGHDARYAIDAGKIGRELGWSPRRDFASGLRLTVEWYLAHRNWWGDIRSGVYRGERLGTAAVADLPGEQ